MLQNFQQSRRNVSLVLHSYWLCNNMFISLITLSYPKCSFLRINKEQIQMGMTWWIMKRGYKYRPANRSVTYRHTQTTHTQTKQNQRLYYFYIHEASTMWTHTHTITLDTRSLSVGNVEIVSFVRLSGINLRFWLISINILDGVNCSSLIT